MQQNSCISATHYFKRAPSLSINYKTFNSRRKRRVVTFHVSSRCTAAFAMLISKITLPLLRSPRHHIFDPFQLRIASIYGDHSSSVRTNSKYMFFPDSSRDFFHLPAFLSNKACYNHAFVSSSWHLVPLHNATLQFIEFVVIETSIQKLLERMVHIFFIIIKIEDHRIHTMHFHLDLVNLS